MSIKQILSQTEIVASLSTTDKAQLLEDLGRRAALGTGLRDAEIVAALASREQLGSTGVGHGIAIPHARLAALKRPYGLFARLERPIEFAAVDSLPVDLVFLLLTPEDEANAQMKLLAAISRRLRDQDVTKRLRAASTAVDIYGILMTGA